MGRAQRKQSYSNHPFSGAPVDGSEILHQQGCIICAYSPRISHLFWPSGKGGPTIGNHYFCVRSKNRCVFFGVSQKRAAKNSSAFLDTTIFSSPCQPPIFFETHRKATNSSRNVSASTLFLLDWHRGASRSFFGFNEGLPIEPRKKPLLLSIILVD